MTHAGTANTSPCRRHLASSAILAFAVGVAWPALAAAQPATAAPPTASAPAAAADGPLRWTFGSSSGGANGWTAERGSITPGQGELRVQPDANRRVVLLSPPGLPDTARTAEQFVLGVTGSGLQRVRIQARRDARGGWITVADAHGASLRKTGDDYAVERNPGGREAPIERLRIELEFRTTNPRGLSHLVIVTPPR